MPLLFTWLHLAVLIRPAPTPDGWRPRLVAAIERAISANPELAAMEARIEASRQRAIQAGTFPDPEVEVGIKDAPVSRLSLSRDDFTMEMITARQGLPGLGKREARTAGAESTVSNATAMHSVHEATVAADVADAFFSITEYDRRLEAIERSHERLKRAAASATERYSVGRAAQSDVLRANLETTAIENRLLSLRAERRAVVARFNALQGLPPNAEVPAMAELDPLPALPDLATIAERATESSPAVAAARAIVRRAESESRLAVLERRPDWAVSTYYGHRARFEDLAGAFVSFNLPFAHPRRLKARRAEMEAELSSARADLDAVRNQIGRDVESSAAELERGLEQAKLYRTSILPQAEINYRAAEESYAVGQIDFQTYIRAALDLDGYEGETATQVSAIGRALAALQKASGLPLLDGTPTFGAADDKQ